MIDVQTDRPLIRSRTSSLRYVRVRLSAPRVGRERPGLNVCLVLDRSGSMKGHKLQLVREAAERCLEMLTPRDRFSIVTYDSQVQVLCPPLLATPESIQTARVNLARLEAGNNTNLAAGWFTGCEQIVEHLRARRIGRCLLLTDGAANEGETEPQALARRAADWRARGVSTSTFGVGQDFNELLLQEIAGRGGGNFYYLESAGQIVDLMTSELGESMEVAISNARLEVSQEGSSRLRPVLGTSLLAGAALSFGAACFHLAPEQTQAWVGAATLAATSGVALLLGKSWGEWRRGASEPDIGVLQPFPTIARPGRLTCELGHLVSRQVVNLILAIQFPPTALGSRSCLDLRLTDACGRVWGSSRLSWRSADNQANDAQQQEPEVMRQVAETFATRARVVALEHNRKGQYEQAAQVLEETAVRLAREASGDGQLEACVEGLRRDQRAYRERMSAGELKSHHYDLHAHMYSRAKEGKAVRW